MVRIIVGILLGLMLAPFALVAWFYMGHPPVAVTDSPLPFERSITHMALNTRVKQEMIATSPVQANESNLVAGAGIYRDQCAACHGFYGKPSAFGAHMYPKAPQLWEKHKNGSVVGVSDDPPGETFWKADNGIRLTGMPSYHSVLTANEIWQVSILLANADKPLPPAALQIVRGEEAPAVPQAGAADSKRDGK